MQVLVRLVVICCTCMYITCICMSDMSVLSASRFRVFDIPHSSIAPGHRFSNPMSFQEHVLCFHLPYGGA